MNPTVSFVIPCYRLAHLLPECVNSILAQTYGDFEILILDDCSPDETAAVAQSFRDPRVRYIRNPLNLGHLRNYNKGIGVARGKYVWLISADDRLRVPYALERYVPAMEDQSNAGYVFCPGCGIEDGRETGVLKYSRHGDRNATFNGRRFLLELLNGNSVVAASGMVRKECYEKVSLFPLDLPYAGDWYLWCIFALRYDVIYFSEPMVSYRVHDLSMTNLLEHQDPGVFVADGLKVLWRIKRKAQEEGCAAAAAKCWRRLIDRYVFYLSSEIHKTSIYRLSFDEFERNLQHNTRSPQEEARLRAKVWVGLGDEYYWRHDHSQALHYYADGLRLDPWMPKVWLKHSLLRSGDLGLWLRESALTARRMIASIKCDQ
jgi:glycosyltransferase involved in cell wall biosynthesis